MPVSHTLHCFDYLRQAIMCYGDSTLEYLTTDFDDYNALEYGYQSHRICRNFNAVLQYGWDHNVVKIGDI